MNDVNRSTIPPQGDRFEDQYTSATADLSAGGVATAREVATPGVASTPQPEIGRGSAAGSEPWSSPGLAREDVTQPWSASGTANLDSNASQRGMLPPPRTMGIGATALVAVAGGVGGAWLYQRWQRERNKPINRIRRGALGLAGRLSERMPDTDGLPGATGPASGAGAALLLSSLIIARALRHDEPPTVQSRVEQSRGILQSAFDFGRSEASRRLQVVILEKVLEEARKRGRDLQTHKIPEEQAKRGGIGLGGMLLIGGIGFVAWRLLRGGGKPATAM